MSQEVMNDAVDNNPQVRITIEVAGLTEVWELPIIGTSLASALTAIESIAAELRERHKLAQQLEREFGDGEVDPDYKI